MSKIDKLKSLMADAEVKIKWSHSAIHHMVDSVKHSKAHGYTINLEMLEWLEIRLSEALDKLGERT